MSDEEMAEEYNEADMGLDEIIAELEEDMHEGMHEDDMEEDMHEGMREDDMEEDMHEGMHEDDMEEDMHESIDDIINEILAEEDLDEGMREDDVEEAHHEGMREDDKELDEALESLEESYKTINHLRSVINEVNLLNAKLLYTNKLFRNFELSESQKMKVIENFDRATTTRETKLVFTTLAESFNKPAKKRVVKESYASRPSASTAPSKEFKENTQILSEGFEHANRWKKLAGLI